MRASGTQGAAGSLALAVTSTRRMHAEFQEMEVNRQSQHQRIASSGFNLIADNEGSKPPALPIATVNNMQMATMFASTTTLKTTLLPPPCPPLTMLEAV